MVQEGPWRMAPLDAVRKGGTAARKGRSQAFPSPGHWQRFKGPAEWSLCLHFVWFYLCPSTFLASVSNITEWHCAFYSNFALNFSLTAKFYHVVRSCYHIFLAFKTILKEHFACMYVYYVHAWYPQKPEEEVRTGVIGGCKPLIRY